MVLLFIIILLFGFMILGYRRARKKYKREQAHIASLVPVELEAYKAAMTKKAAEKAKRRQESSDTWRYGKINPQMICQHCGVPGSIRTQPITTKQGISGGKATAARLTGGVSLLATGLSRNVANTQARCGNCCNVWSL
jgi:hypothetical protein